MVHEVIYYILKISPTASTILLKVLNLSFPYIKKSTYTSNIC